MSEFQWFYGIGEYPEAYSSGGETREFTIERAKEEAKGDAYTITEAKYAVPHFKIFDADNLIEQYEEANEECWGEDGACIDKLPPGVGAELEDELAAVYERWARKHGLVGHVWCFGEQRNEEFFPADPRPLQQDNQS